MKKCLKPYLLGKHYFSVAIKLNLPYNIHLNFDTEAEYSEARACSVKFGFEVLQLLVYKQGVLVSWLKNMFLRSQDYVYSTCL